MTLAQQFNQCLRKESEESLKEWRALRSKMICEGYLISCGWCHLSVIFSDGSVSGCSFDLNHGRYFTRFEE